MAAISDLAEAMMYYTGGLYRIDIRDDRWRSFANRLKQAGYTPHEFLHWFITTVARGESSKLTYKHYLLSEKVWQVFEHDKQNRREEVGIIIPLQREKMEGVMRIMGNEALLNDSIEVNPAIRVEIALYLQEMEDFDPTAVLDKYRGAAEHMLLGCPEYRDYLPYLAEIKWWKS